MDKDVHTEFIDASADVSLGPPGEKDVLDSQQRDEDEGGSDCFHVGYGLGAVGLLQFGDQHSDDVEEKEKVHLDGLKFKRRYVKDFNDPSDCGTICYSIKEDTVAESSVRALYKYIL